MGIGVSAEPAAPLLAPTGPNPRHGPGAKDGISDTARLSELLSLLQSRVREIFGRVPPFYGADPLRTAAAVGQALSEYRALEADCLDKDLENGAIRNKIDSAHSDAEVAALERELRIAKDRLRSLSPFRVPQSLESWDRELRKMAVEIAHMHQEIAHLADGNVLLEGRVALWEQRIALMRPQHAHHRRLGSHAR
jgi:hypothetical protein